MVFPWLPSSKPPRRQYRDGAAAASAGSAPRQGVAAPLAAAAARGHAEPRSKGSDLVTG